jgi:methyl-accepting chemotaxis protein
MKQEERRIPWRKRKFYVHSIQRKYFVISLIPLVICTLLLILLLFVPLKLALLRLDFGPEKSAIINNIYPLVSLIWPAAVISMLAYAVVFYFVTHRLIGPLPRLQRIFRKIAEGDLTHSAIRVRPKDDLEEFARFLDGAFGTLVSALSAIRDQEDLAVRELAVLQDKIRGELSDTAEILQALEGIIGHQTEMEKVLSYFKFPGRSSKEGHKSG